MRIRKIDIIRSLKNWFLGHAVLLFCIVQGYGQNIITIPVLDPGDSICIVYDVRINTPLPIGVGQVQCQDTVTVMSPMAIIPTSDPDSFPTMFATTGTLICNPQAGTLTGQDTIICPGDTISVSLSGNQTAPEYTQVFLVIDQSSGDIISIETDTNLVLTAIDTYKVYSFNYLTSSVSDTTGLTNISDIVCDTMGTCCDTSMGIFCIIVGDSIPPIITCSSDAIVNGCNTGQITNGGMTSLPFSSVAAGVSVVNFLMETGSAVSDNCGIDTIIYQDIATGTCPIVVTRTFIAFDLSMNSDTCMQTINIQDTIPPIITCPSDITVDGCNTGEITNGGMTALPFSTAKAGVTVANFLMEIGAMVSDNCGIDTIVYQDIQSGMCPIVVTRTFIVFDSCMNSDTCMQTINIQDTIPPMITCPLEIDVDGCDSSDITNGGFTSLPYSSVATGVTQTDFLMETGAMVSDNCAIDTIIYQDSETGMCPIVVTRTFIVFDSCMNSDTCMQTINIQDTIPPMITCPDDIDVDGCDTSEITNGGFTSLPYSSVATGVTQADFLMETGAMVSDNCTIDTIIYQDSETGMCPVVVTRTFIVFDSCMNSDTCMQTINIQDTIPPMLTCPTDLDVDGCSTNDITLGMTSLPFASIQTGVTMAAFMMEGGAVSDNCNIDTIIYQDVASGLCPIVVTRTFIAFDSCMNSDTCIQTINIQDTIPPMITCPTDINVEGCDPGEIMNGNLTAFAFSTIPVGVTVAEFLMESGAMVSDNCNIDTIIYQDSETGSCPIVATRTFIVFDSCQNSDTCMQTITINDTTVPTITCPTNIPLVEGCGPTDITNGGLTALPYAPIRDTISTVQFLSESGAAFTDNCGVIISYMDVSMGSCPWTVMRTFIIADSCQNADTCTQTITIDDTIDPVITTCPPDPGVNLEGCSGMDVLKVSALPLSRTALSITLMQFNGENGVVTDDCGIANIVYSDTVVGVYPAPIVVTRTFIVQDPCMNADTCMQTFTFTDTTPPSLQFIPDMNLDATLDCIGELPDFTPLAMVFDTCDASPVVTQTPIPGSNVPFNTTFEVTIRATDAAGNVDSIQFMVSIAESAGDVTLNCRDANLSISTLGEASFQVGELVQGASCLDLLDVRIETLWGGLVQSASGVIRSSMITIDACPYRDQELKATFTNVNGSSCWSLISFKQASGPVFEPGRRKDIYCLDSLVQGGHILGAPPGARLPCGDQAEVRFVADWVQPIDCDVAANGTAANDTVKIILREYEAFDKLGRRSSAFDTLVIYRLPPMAQFYNAYCAEKDTLYCGEGFVGPYMTYLEKCPIWIGGMPLEVGEDYDGDGVLCDTLFFLDYKDGQIVARDIDPKCGIKVHVDAWPFANSCEKNWKVTLEVKQDCYGAFQDLTATGCFDGTLPSGIQYHVPGGGISTVAPIPAPIYAFCEFWITDIDTVPPEVQCKGPELFTGPFDISRWELIEVQDDTNIPGVQANFVHANEFFNLNDLPYALIVESEYRDIFPFDAEPEVAQTFLPSPYFANAVAKYTATENVEFNFSWDFTLEPTSGMTQINPPSLIPPIHEGACASIFLTVNEDTYYIVEGELCNLIGFGDKAAVVLNNHPAPIQVNENKYGGLSVPLKAGDQMSITAIWDSGVPATFRIMGQNVVNTTTHECAAHTYIPPVKVYDDWTGIKMVKAMIEEVGTYLLEFDESDSCWVSHKQVKLPKREMPYKVIFEAYDSCHNVGKDSCYIFIKDITKPVVVADKGVTVSLSDKKVWVNAETFDEGSWDNCGVNMMLVRRADWYEELACVDICDSIDYCWIGEHHDTIWQAFLEPDKHKNEVEAHYAKTLEWLCTDGTPCAEIMYNAWLYDLMKYATLNCVDHSYEVDNDYFHGLFKGAIRDPEFYNKFRGCDPEHREIQDDFAIATLSAQEIFGIGHFVPLHQRIDMYEQIGGGWSDAVPFSCEDACSPVTVEILVMDYWCNWSKAWTEVWVEDKTPITVVKDVIDGEINCKTYRSARYAYPGEIHPVSIDYIVEKAKSGDQDAYDLLDQIFGGYCKAWVDPYGNWVDEEGTEIECDIPFSDSTCECSSWYELEQVYDEHLGYKWDSIYVDSCWYNELDTVFQKGIVTVNCAENVYCEQEVWCEFDHCGQGYLFRKFKIWQGCPPHDERPDSLSAHIPDTIYRHQRIWVGNDCALDKKMFDVPEDAEVYSCGIEYDPEGSGNVVGIAGPENTGAPVLKDVFDRDCRIIGIAHHDKVFKIVGGNEACYKIIRTWYFADWCGEKPIEALWWRNRDLVQDSCIQKIIIRDTVPPECVVTGPVENGDTIQAGDCYYNFEADVSIVDVCGVIEYHWELLEVSSDNPSLVELSSGTLNGQEVDAFNLVVEDLSTGSYKLKVRVRDECQNESYCNYTFTVMSGKKPTPICISMLTARLNPMDRDQDGQVDTAMATIWASEFNSSSEVACQDTTLDYRIELLDGLNDDTWEEDADSLVVGCANFGSKLVRLWVISRPSGTVDYCDVALIIQTDFQGCGLNQNGNTPLHESMELDAKLAEAEKEGNKIVHVENRDGVQSGRFDDKFVLHQNRPNPFRVETNIGFNLPEATNATLTIFDVTGKVLRVVKGSYSKGYSEISINYTEIGGVSGVLYYQLDTERYTATRKMILIR